MRMLLLPVLYILMSALRFTDDFVPRITESRVDSHLQRDDRFISFSTGKFYHFRGSETLMLQSKSGLQVSFDNGEHWKSVGSFVNNRGRIEFDKFHHGRAFIMGDFEKVLYVTEDQGKSWEKISLPIKRERKKISKDSSCYFKTHPSDKNLVLLHCNIIHKKFRPSLYWGIDEYSNVFTEAIVYVSEDSGKSFTRIGAPVEKLTVTLDLVYYGSTCEFANSAKDSSFSKNDIYCIHNVEKLSDSQKWFSLPSSIDHSTAIFEEVTFLKPTTRVLGTLFYTSDFGQSTKTFDELKNLSVRAIWTLPSKILVATSRSRDADCASSELWISTGGSFKLAHFPEGVTLSLSKPQNLFEVDSKRLLLYGNVMRNGDSRKSECLLISDLSGLNYSLTGPTIEQQDHSMFFGKLENFEKSIWGGFLFREEVNRRTLDTTVDASSMLNEYKLYSMTKVSFDSGRTLQNPRVVDPSGKYKHLFECDIDDIEHCSFQEASSYYSKSGHEPMAGILIKTGVVGDSALIFDDKNLMTFISRNGGASWEVIFEYPVYATLLNFGNIIVCVPEENTGLYTKFFFSLDQGKNWKEYYFYKSISARDVIIDSSGLKAIIGFHHVDSEIAEYLFYSLDFTEAYNAKARVADD